MATLRIPGGAAGARLAVLLVEENPGSAWEQVPGGIEVRGGRLVLERRMVEEAYWPGAEPDARAAERFMRFLVRADPKTVRVSTTERIVVADDVEADQPLLVRFPAALKERLAQTAERLGMSQNEMVIRAVEDLLAFVDEFEGE
jgi:hypothetical protein